MKYIFKLIRFFRKPNAAGFAQQGQQILGVFSKAKQELLDLNDKQIEYQASLMYKVNQIKAEQSQVSDAIRENHRVIHNITQLTY